MLTNSLFQETEKMSSWFIGMLFRARATCISHFTRKGINCNEKPHEHIRYQKNAENLLISTYIVAEFGRSSFLRNLHLKLTTFSSSFFYFPEISMEKVTADPKGLFLSKCLPSYPVSYTHLTLPTIYSV